MGVKRSRNPVVTIQFPDGSARRLRDNFHRAEADGSSADDLHAALDRILGDPIGTLREVRKTTFNGRKKNGDDGVKEAVQQIAAAA